VFGLVLGGCVFGGWVDFFGGGSGLEVVCGVCFGLGDVVGSLWCVEVLIVWLVLFSDALKRFLRVAKDVSCTEEGGRAVFPLLSKSLPQGTYQRSTRL